MSIKDTDLAGAAESLRAAAFVFVVLTGTGIVFFVRWVQSGALEHGLGWPIMVAVIGLIVVLTLSLISGLVISAIADRGSANMAEAMMGAHTRRDFREQRAGDIDRIRYYLRQGEFADALALIEDILHEDPDFPEVLSLKARVLWEGRGDSGGAWRELRRVMLLVPRDDPHHRWAAEYYKTVTGNAEDPEA